MYECKYMHEHTAESHISDEVAEELPLAAEINYHQLSRLKS